MICIACKEQIVCECCGETEYSQHVTDGHSFVPKKCSCLSVERSTGRLIEVVGDATTPQRVEEDEIVFIPHVCNDFGGWGAGFVVALSRKWSKPEQSYRQYFENHVVGTAALGIVNTVKAEEGIYVSNMIAQHGYKREDTNPRPLKYEALIKCMREVVKDIIYSKSEYGHGLACPPHRIHCPKFGSDLAGGKWEFIVELIEEIWLSAGIDVVVYEYVG